MHPEKEEKAHIDLIKFFINFNMKIFNKTIREMQRNILTKFNKAINSYRLLSIP